MKGYVKCSQCSGSGIKVTGVRTELNDRDKNRKGAHLLNYKLQYQCRGCGHFGWTRNQKALKHLEETQKTVVT